MKVLLVEDDARIAAEVAEALITAHSLLGGQP